jgi:hypothetical protein
MSSALSPARRRASRGVRWLAAAALGGLALMAAATAAQAQSASRAVPARAATHLLTTGTPIAMNTANWSPNAGYGSQPPAWTLDIFGIVHLQGAAAQISAAGPFPELIGTLPPAEAPTTAVFATANTFNATSAGVEIDPSGEIIAIPPTPPAPIDFRFFSLDGISFATNARGLPVPINTQNWSYCAGCDARALSWYTDNSDVVHLEGAVSQVSASGNEPNVIGTLPQAAAPAQTVYTIVHTAGGYADLAIEPSGQLDLIDPRPPATKDYSLVSLESITYRASGRGSPIALNDTNWSGQAGFDSRPPGWYTDASGLVHLQGAVHQTSGSGPKADVIGTLPVAAAPSYTVHEAVHTYLGTYANLTVQPSGVISLSSPPPPLVTDYSFVSLEGITYQR